MSLLKIGHRGAMGYEPENTLGSFKRTMGGFQRGVVLDEA